MRLHLIIMAKLFSSAIAASSNKQMQSDAAKAAPLIWALYFTENELDEQEQKALTDIAKFGCHVLNVMEGEEQPEFSYSI